MPKGSTHVGNTGGKGPKGQGVGNTGGQSVGSTGSKGPKGQGFGPKQGKNKHVKGSAGWQAAHDAYARVVGPPPAAGGQHGAGKGGIQPLWVCRGPGGCQHDKNPGGPGGTKACLNCGLPWGYGARPAFWGGLAARTAAKAAAGSGSAGKGARRPPPGVAGPPGAGGPAGGGVPAAGNPPPGGTAVPVAGRPPGPLATAEGLAALVGVLGDEHTAVADYKVRLQQQAPPLPPPPAEPAGSGRTQENLAQLQKVLGAEHEACRAYAEELRKEKDAALLPEQRVAGKVRYSAVLEGRKAKAQARVSKAEVALAAAQLEADAAAERLTTVEEQIAVIADEIQSLMSAAASEEVGDTAMAPEPSAAPQLSTQELVEALQTQVRGNLEAGADEAVKAVLGPFLDMLKQAQAAIALLSAQTAAAPAAVAAGGSEAAAGPEAVAVSRVAHLRGTFERPGWGKDRLMDAMRAADRHCGSKGPY